MDPHHPTKDPDIASCDTYWMKARLLFRQLRPVNQTLATIERPFARLSADPRADIVLETGNASEKMFVIATGEGLRCFDLSQSGPPADSVAPSKGSVQWGPYAIEWVSDASPAIDDRAVTWPQVEFSYKGRVLAQRTLQQQVTILGRGAPSNLCVTHPEISRTHCAMYWDNSALWIIDLFSANGVFTNQGFVDCTRLFPGGAINVGPVVMRLYGESEHGLSLSAPSMSSVEEDESWDDFNDASPTQSDPRRELQFSTPAVSQSFDDLDLEDDMTSHHLPLPGSNVTTPSVFGGPLASPFSPPPRPSKPAVSTPPESQSITPAPPPLKDRLGVESQPPDVAPLEESILQLRQEQSALALKIEQEIEVIRAAAHDATSAVLDLPPLIRQLGQRLDDLERQRQGLDQRLQAVERQGQGLDKRLEDAEKQRQGLDQRLQAVEQQGQGLDQRLEEAEKQRQGLDQRLVELGQRLEHLGRIQVEQQGLGLAVEQLQIQAQSLAERLEATDASLGASEARQDQDQLRQDALQAIAEQLQTAWREWSARREDEMVTLVLRMDDLEQSTRAAVEQPTRQSSPTETASAAGEVRRLREAVESQAEKIGLFQHELAKLRLKSWTSAGASAAAAPEAPSRLPRKLAATSGDSLSALEEPLAAFIENQKRLEAGKHRWYLFGIVLTGAVIIALAGMLLRPWLWPPS